MKWSRMFEKMDEPVAAPDAPTPYPPDDLLTLRYDPGSDGHRIINGRGETLGITMLSSTQLIMEVPTKSMSEALRWVMSTGQYRPAEKATPNPLPR